MPHDTSRGRTNPHTGRPAQSRNGQQARSGQGRAGQPHGRPAKPRPGQPGPAAGTAGKRPAPRQGKSRRHERPLRAGDPRSIGGYRLLGRLGEGGQGVVYLGRDGDDRLVTVKVLRGGLDAGQRARSRFVKEAEAARKVAGRHTARVLDADVTGDRPYIVSEFVEGPPLQRVVDEDGPLPAPQLRKVALRTAGALAAIHRAGIVHRDFKPANVVLGPDGAKVIDFGIARAADALARTEPLTTSPVGTPGYMAPEQIEDEPVGPPADVFAWGAAMVFAATGRPPFGSGPSAAVMRRVTSRPPDLGDMEGPLRELAARCLDKNPAARPTAPQLVRALREGQGPAPKPRPTRIPRYRWRMMLALAAVIIAGFVLGVLF
ncbi:Serine/threonine-protein kinase PknD [Actinomadura sp. RB99]|uniref:serine/threonine-protein kinase n=1 Tax=Actinomadura sp. RB99 TaxID=2691577 RepID=UPI0019B70F9F|nr:serine/threonine-protein kinase [Actinomadura sp. RB99]MBD2896809.1 Serine/threonine-protein kinase PknD [Actinomadura sp. RB99]